MKIEKKGLNQVVDKINKFAKLPEKADKMLYELAKLGEQELREAYSEPQIDQEKTSTGYVDRVHTPKITVGIEQKGNQTTLWADGEQLLFFEFGAGITHNTPRPWSNVLNVQIPPEVSDIGTYNKGFGAFPYWHYSINGKGSIKTEGIRARAGFANAINTITFNTEKVVKEVLNE